MRQDIDMRTILNEAAKSGLLLGLFTGVFIYVAMLIGMINSDSFGAKLMITVVNALLWMLKLVGCLWLLRFFMIMIRFAVANPTLTPRSSFRFGMFTALFSAIIVAGIGLVNITLIAPESMQSAIEAAMQSYSSALSASDQVSLERTLSRLPQISFFSSLVYCFLFGTVAAKIFSASIPPRDIFGEPTDSNEE